LLCFDAEEYALPPRYALPPFEFRQACCPMPTLFTIHVVEILRRRHTPLLSRRCRAPRCHMLPLAATPLPLLRHDAAAT